MTSECFRAADRLRVSIPFVLPEGLQPELLAAVQSTATGITLVDVFQPNQPLVFVNDAFCHMTGFSRNEVLGRNCRFLQGSETDPAAVDVLRSAIRARDNCCVTLRNYRKDGTPFWVELRVGPSSSPNFFFGVQQDVSQQVEARYREERVRDSLRRFAYSVSHDLRAPLRQIRQLCEFLSEDLQEGDSSSATQNARHLIAITQTLETRTSGLLTSAQVALGTRKAEPISMDAAVESALRSLQFDIERSEAKIHVGPLPEIEADQFAMVQLWQNLIGNALKYSADDRTPWIEIRAIEQEDGTLFQVEDNGCGIPKDQRETIFEPFVRANERKNGYGLGLGLCRQIVTELGGRVWAECREPHGSRFCFVVPR